jgi:ubiquinone/menaquinone biosynthesis C-methylase UbiE
MSSQKEKFKNGEGDSWFRRNNKTLETQTSDDRIANILQSIELAPKKVLEIGCCDGQRLDLIRMRLQADCHGIDPSSEAIATGKERFPEISLQVGTADNLPFSDGEFDLVIFGFCLYLCDRNELFKIALEADRCLQDKSSLVIHDFYPPFPYRNKYAHLDGIYSYKMNYVRMFTWNPAYTEIYNTVYSHSGYALRDVPDERIAIVVLRKNEESAYAEEPFR